MVNTGKKSIGTKMRKVMKIFAVICDTVCTVALILVVILVVFLLIFNTGQPTTKFFGNTFVYILSDSMNPDFKKGDVVFIESCKPEDLEPGDIIAFYRNYSADPLANIYFHRIMDIKSDDDNVLYFQTKGDANKSPDSGWVKADNIAGVYSGRLAFLQRFLNFAVTANGCVFLIIIPCGTVFMFEVIALINWFDEGAKIKKALSVLPRLEVNTAAPEPLTGTYADEYRPPLTADTVTETVTPEEYDSIPEYETEINRFVQDAKANKTLPELPRPAENYAPKPVTDAFTPEKSGNPPGETDADSRLVIKEALSRCYDKIETIVIDKLSNEQ